MRPVSLPCVPRYSWQRSANQRLDFLYVFGVSEDEELRMQIWTGYDWQPGFNQTWPLGDVTKDVSTAASTEQDPAQSVLGALEL